MSPTVLVVFVALVMAVCWYRIGYRTGWRAGWLAYHRRRGGFLPPEGDE